MKYIRIFFSAISFICFGLGGIFIGTVIFPFLIIVLPKHKSRKIMVDIIHWSWKFFVSLMSFLRLISVNIKNSDRLNGLKRTIVVANHPSLIDIVILISAIPNSVCIVKGQLASNIFMKKIIKAIYIINDSPQSFLNDASKAINEGYNVIIFPEGTRTSKNIDSQDIKLHRGFAQLAIKNKGDILPIKIHMNYRVLSKEQAWYDVGSKTVKYVLDILSIMKVEQNCNSDHLYAIKLTNEIKEVLF